MASNMWKVVHRIWRLKPFAFPPIKETFSVNQAVSRLMLSCRTPTTTLFAAAPMVWNHADGRHKAKQDEEDDEDDDDDDDEDDDEEEEDQDTEFGIRKQMIRQPPSRADVANWTNNAESHPGYQATVRAAREILATPPPPPPKFPAMPVGFCADPEKVPPKPPSLPAMHFIGVKDDNDNHSKLPDNCPKQSPTLTNEECTSPIVVTPKMPDLPFCDRPVQPPIMPIPPPCGTMGPPPPPPPDPPAMLVSMEDAPPPLPLPPSLYYDLTDPPEPFTPDISNTPPLPCFPLDHPDAAMNKCDMSGNNSVQLVPDLPARGQRGEQLTPSPKGKRSSSFPPPPPMMSAVPTQRSSWDESGGQKGMLKTDKRKKRKPKAVEGTQDDNNPSTLGSERAFTEDTNQNQD